MPPRAVLAPPPSACSTPLNLKRLPSRPNLFSHPARAPCILCGCQLCDVRAGDELPVELPPKCAPLLRLQSQQVSKFLIRRVTDRLAAAGIRFQVTVLEYHSPSKSGLSAIGEAICRQADALQASRASALYGCSLQSLVQQKF
jgi:hypothetical protein